MAGAGTKIKFALCINDSDCDDLEKGMVYLVRSDAAAKREGYLRIFDASGEDYLYPETYFVLVDLPEQARDALLATK
ncbi:MAG: hypothetical protein SH868_09880 [Bythopirellula sp.]|nr:hypothetical protein [Bythopirellula sp.]